MILTDYGARAAQLGARERLNLGNELIQGNQNVSKYTSSVCYDATAFVRFLMTSRITHTNLTSQGGQGWIDLLGFKEPTRTEWDGSSSIPAGTAVGFWRLQGESFFHAAIAVGETKVRSVNSLKLGYDWTISVDLTKVLNKRTDDGYFEFDNGGKVKVFCSTV